MTRIGAVKEAVDGQKRYFAQVGRAAYLRCG